MKIFEHLDPNQLFSLCLVAVLFPFLYQLIFDRIQDAVYKQAITMEIICQLK